MKWQTGLVNGPAEGLASQVTSHADVSNQVQAQATEAACQAWTLAGACGDKGIDEQALHIFWMLTQLSIVMSQSAVNRCILAAKQSLPLDLLYIPPLATTFHNSSSLACI